MKNKINNLVMNSLIGEYKLGGLSESQLDILLVKLRRSKKAQLAIMVGIWLVLLRGDELGESEDTFKDSIADMVINEYDEDTKKKFMGVLELINIPEDMIGNLVEQDDPKGFLRDVEMLDRTKGSTMTIHTYGLLQALSEKVGITMTTARMFQVCFAYIGECGGAKAFNLDGTHNFPDQEKEFKGTEKEQAKAREQVKEKEKNGEA